MSEAVIVDLSGTQDGVNKSFTSPTRFVLGTFRLIWNGVVYSPTDTRKGWVEVNDTTIETTTPPQPNDKLQGFVTDADSMSGTIPEVIGSPFDPTGTLP